ncbi:MAG: ribonuclease III [Solirubrobacterales bacterium]|nr:ribonuclease III [Solirubrobacterales bacterium]
MTPGTASLAELFADTPEELRRQALSHSSWVGRRTESYGRLAFLGDSVLGLSVAALLFEAHPDADIGELTKILNQAVSGRACAEVARRLELPEMLSGEAPDDGDGLPVDTLLASERTLASVCEAVIGACYLAHGFERTSAAIIEAFEDEVEQATRQRLDFKSELQERLARDGVTVSYEVASEAGPPHDRRFEIRATVGEDELGVGSGRSKKEAEQAAARRALKKLRG